MKLNPDCIRDILMDIEEAIPGTGYVLEYDQKTTKERLPNYSHEEIMYHVRQCDLSGFLYKARFNISGSYDIQDLTPAGHQFLADIRSDTVWNKTKNVAAQIGVYSLDTLTKIATGVITELIKRQF